MSKEEITVAREIYCRCVNSFIDAYQVKLREIRTLQHMIQIWRKKCSDRNQVIDQLKHENTELQSQLATKVCEDCGEKRITEQLNALSMREKKGEV